MATVDRARWEVYLHRPGDLSNRIGMGVSRMVDAVEQVSRALSKLPSTAFGSIWAGFTVLEFQRTPDGLTFREITLDNPEITVAPWRKIPAAGGDSGSIGNQGSRKAGGHGRQAPTQAD